MSMSEKEKEECRDQLILAKAELEMIDEALEESRFVGPEKLRLTKLLPAKAARYYKLRRDYLIKNIQKLEERLGGAESFKEWERKVEAGQSKRELVPPR
jgi:hypothetical protein